MRWHILLAIVLIAGCTRAPAPATTSTAVPALQAAAPFNGTRIAGNASPLLEFSVHDYTEAVSSDRLVVVYFYADWCPVCKSEFPEMKNAFDQLTTDRVVGFRVHYNDGSTDEYARELASQLGIPYQHTKVIMRKGQLLLKSPESWTKDRYLLEIGSRL